MGVMGGVSNLDVTSIKCGIFLHLMRQGQSAEPSKVTRPRDPEDPSPFLRSQ